MSSSHTVCAKHDMIVDVVRFSAEIPLESGQQGESPDVSTGPMCGNGEPLRVTVRRGRG